MITFLKKKIVEQRETFQFISSLASVFPLMKSFEKKKKNQIRERKNYRQLKGIFFKEFFRTQLNFEEKVQKSKKKFKKKNRYVESKKLRKIKMLGR